MLVVAAAGDEPVVGMPPRFPCELFDLLQDADIYLELGIDRESFACEVWHYFSAAGLPQPTGEWSRDPKGQQREWVLGAARAISEGGSARRRSPEFWAWMWGCVDRGEHHRYYRFGGYMRSYSGEEVAARMRAAFEKGSSETRISLLWMCRGWDNAHAESVIVEALRGEDDTVVQLALEVLSGCEAVRTPTVREAVLLKLSWLSDQPPLHRKQLIEAGLSAVASVGLREAELWIRERMQEDDARDFFHDALWALHAIGLRVGVPEMVQCIRLDPHPSTVDSMGELIVEQGTPGAVEGLVPLLGAHLRHGENSNEAIDEAILAVLETLTGQRRTADQWRQEITGGRR